MKYKKNLSLIVSFVLFWSFFLPSEGKNVQAIQDDIVIQANTDSETTLLDLDFDDLKDGTEAKDLGFEITGPGNQWQSGANVKPNPDGKGKSLYMFDNCVEKAVEYNSLKIRYPFVKPQTDGVVTAEVRFMQDTVVRERMGIMNLVDSDGKYLVRMITDPSTENIALLPQGAPQKFLQYEPGVWYTIKVVVDVKLNQIQIYVNGNLVWNRRPTIEPCKDLAAIEVYTPGASEEPLAAQYIDYIKVKAAAGGYTPDEPENIVAYSKSNKIYLTWDSVLQASSSSVATRGMLTDTKYYDYHVGYEVWISDDKNAEFYDGYVMPDNGDNRTDQKVYSTYNYGSPVAGKNVWTLANTVRTNTAFYESVTVDKLFAYADNRTDYSAEYKTYLKTLQNGKPYYIKIRALNKEGVAGPFSEIIECTPGSPVSIATATSSVMKDFKTFNLDYASEWSIRDNLSVGDLVYNAGSTMKFTAIPEKYKGKSWVSPHYNTRNYGRNAAAGETSELMEFTAADDCEVIIAMDTNALTDAALANMPDQWIINEGWNLLSGEIVEADNGAVKYQLFKKDFAKGDKVVLKAMLANGKTAVANTYITIVNVKPLNLTVESLDEIVGKEVVTVKGSISRPAYVDISINGQAVQKDIYLNSSLSFAKDITLAKGLNNIEVKAYNTEGIAEVYTYKITYDCEAPVVTVKPIEKSVNNLQLNITGSSKEKAKITAKVNSTAVISDLEVEVEEEFTIPLILKNGVNKIDLEVVDVVGNVTRLSYETELKFWVDKINLKDAGGNAAASIKEGEMLYAEVTAGNKTDSDKKSMLVLTFYDSDNVMLNFTASEVLLKQNEVVDISCAAVAPANAVKVKAFVWEDITKPVPLSETYLLKP
jgi:hypothetical protein